MDVYPQPAPTEPSRQPAEIPPDPPGYGVPAPQTTPLPLLPLATIDQRFVALLIDQALAYGLVKLAEKLSGPSTSLPTIATVIAYWVFLAWCISKYHGTPGKLLMGIWVTDRSGRPASFGQGLLRESVGRLISHLFFVSYVSTYVQPYRQTWHDKLARTVVIRKPARGMQYGGIDRQTSTAWGKFLFGFSIVLTVLQVLAVPIALIILGGIAAKAGVPSGPIVLPTPGQ
jgi:uncharacterized RDD family membrane protein YckC